MACYLPTHQTAFSSFLRFVADIQVSHNPNPARLNKAYFPSADTRVEIVSFHPHSEWLATCDRNVKCHLSTISLKFWSWSIRQQCYVLHTTVQNPHKEKLSAFAFHPSKSLAVSTSHDLKFKLWEAMPVTTTGRTQWGCVCVGEYHGQMPRSVDFSSDGSILAISFSGSVTLWSTDSWLLLHVLHSSPPQFSISQVVFMSKCPFVIACSAWGVHVWNVISTRVHWCARLSNILHMSQVPNTSQFLVLSELENNLKSTPTKASSTASSECRRLTLFSVEASRPLGFWSVANSKYKSFAVLPTTESKAGKFTVVLFHVDGGFLLLASSDFVPTPQNLKKGTAKSPKSSLAQVYGTALGNTTQPKQIIHNFAKDSQLYGADDLFSSIPSHVIPPCSTIYPSFMGSKLHKLEIPKRSADEVSKNENNATLAAVPESKQVSFASFALCQDFPPDCILNNFCFLDFPLQQGNICKFLTNGYTII